MSSLPSPPFPVYNRGIGLYGAPSVRASHTARPTVDFMYNRNQNIFMVPHECGGKEQMMDGKNIHISEFGLSNPLSPDFIVYQLSPTTYSYSKTAS